MISGAVGLSNVGHSPREYVSLGADTGRPGGWRGGWGRDSAGTRRLRGDSPAGPRGPRPRPPGAPGVPRTAHGRTVPRGARRRRHVGVDDDFFALGGDAVAAATLLDVSSNRTAACGSPDTATTGVVTADGLVDRVGRSRPTRRTRVVGFGTELPGDAAVLHDGGVPGGARCACAFNEAAGRPFYAVQQAGLEGRSRVDRTIRRRARRAVGDIRAVQPTGPYLLAGYSSDSRVVLEAARRLRGIR